MDFELIAIKVDPGTALTTLDKATAELRKTEAAGQAAAKSMLGVSGAFKSLGQALQQEQAALARLNTMHEQLARQSQPLAQGFGRIAEQLAREKSVLEQIRAPQMEYFDTLTALDKLLERNAISTQEYAAQVTKLNQSIEKTPKRGGGGFDAKGAVAQVASLGGAAGSVIGGAVGGGIVGAAVAGIGAIGDYIEKQRQLEDEYTTLINQEMKFTDAMHSLSSVMAQQTELASSLHATLKETGAAYDSVQDAVVGLNLSSRDTATLTKAVGQAAVISGKSMESAGDVLNRMTLAMDSGADAGRALKGALTGYDAISDALTAHFNTTREGLVQMVNAHKIGSRDIIEALQAESGAIQEQFDKRKITNEQELAMVKERENAYRQSGVPTILAVMAARNKDAAEAMKYATDSQYGEKKAMDEALGTVEQLTKDLENMSGGFQKVGDVLHERAGRIVEDFGLMGQAASDFSREIDRALGHDPWAGLDEKTGLLKYLPLGLKTWTEFNHAVDANKAAIDDLNAAYVAGAFGDLNNPKSAARATGIFFEKLEALTAGLGKQKAALTEHTQAVQRDLETEASLLALQRDFNPAFGGSQAIAAAQQAAADFKKLADDSRAAIEKDNEAARQHEAELAKLPGLYDQWEASAHDALSGLDSGWKQIVSDATDSGKHIKDAMTGAFSAIEDSLVSMVTKGKLDLGSLGSALESILVKFAVQQAMGGLTGLIGGGMTGFDYMAGSSRLQFPGFATGGDMLVGGAGAPDSKLAMFRVSPGESIHVRTPQQREAAMQGGAGGTTIVNAFNFDQKTFRSKIVSDLMNSVRNNPAAFRALLGL